MLVPEGTRLVFGRGPGVDLIIAAGRGLSRRAGLVTAMAAGAWIANISRTHALYVEGDGYQVRLPRMEHDGEPANGWFMHAGTALVGSRAMLDDGQALVVTVTGQYEEAAPVRWADGAELTGTGLTGTGLAGTELAGTELAGAGLAGTGLTGTGLAGPGLTGTGVTGTGVTGTGVTGTGVADDGEWTDEVYAANASGQTEIEDTGRAGTGLSRPAQTGAGRAYAGLTYAEPAGAGEAGGPGLAARDGDGTLLPFYLDPMTKLFLVALIWCRPWLVDPSATRPLPRTPEIARGALEVTGAYHELERFDGRPGVPRPALGPRGRAHQGAPAQDRRPRAGRRRRPALGRGGRPDPDRARHHHLRPT